jgi:hypothetical protein
MTHDPSSVDKQTRGPRFQWDQLFGYLNSNEPEDWFDGLVMATDELQRRLQTPLTARHGTKYRYGRGCRCDECREAKNRKQRERRAGQPGKNAAEIRARRQRQRETRSHNG